jgi:hypothetical protein
MNTDAARRRDPRVDPHAGDSLEHPTTGNVRRVKSVANRRVHYTMIDSAARTFERSIRLDIRRTKMRGATVVHVQDLGVTDDEIERGYRAAIKRKEIVSFTADIRGMVKAILEAAR